MNSIRPFLIGALALGVNLAAATSALHAQAHDHAAMHASGPGDSVAVADAVHQFHAALEAGDTAAALGALAADVRVLEGGGLETFEEYRSHHLPGDMAFAAAVARKAGPLSVTVAGDAAWVVSTSRTSGTFRDRQIDSMGVELMVLTREADGWRIRAIHWSSRQAR